MEPQAPATTVEAPAVDEAVPAGRRRASLLKGAAVLAILGGLGVAWVGRPTHEAPRFCHADGYILGDGAVLRRDADHDCRWVDENGTPVPTDADGAPQP